MAPQPPHNAEAPTLDSVGTRVAPAPLGFIVLSVFAGGALALAIAMTVVLVSVSSPDFYVEHLRAVGIFNELAERRVPELARARVAKVYPRANKDVGADAARIAGKTFTADWFAERTRDAFKALFAHLRDPETQLEVHLPVADRVQAAGRATNDLLPRSEVARSLYRDITAQAVDQVVRRNARLPFGLTVERGVWSEAVRIAADRDWVVAQVQRQIDHCVGYLVGDIDRLALTIPLYERQDELVAAVRYVVQKSNIRAYVYDSIVMPAIRENVEKKDIIPEVGLELSKDELLAAVDAVLDSRWVRERELDIIETVAEYMVGRRERLELVVPLRGVKRLAAELLTAAIEKKVDGYFETLPECRESELIFSLLHEEVVRCRPAGLDLAATKVLLGVEVQDAVWAELDARIPDTWTHTEEAIRGDVSERTWDLVQRGRTWMRYGVTLDEAKLRSALRQDSEDYLERMLTITRHGWTLRAADFTKDPAKASELESAMESIRHIMGQVWSGWSFFWLCGMLSLLSLIAMSGPGVAPRLLWSARAGLLSALVMASIACVFYWLGAPGEAWLAARVDHDASGPALHITARAPAAVRAMATTLTLRIALVAAIIGFASAASLWAVRKGFGSSSMSSEAEGGP